MVLEPSSAVILMPPASDHEWALHVYDNWLITDAYFFSEKLASSTTIAAKVNADSK